MEKQIICNGHNITGIVESFTQGSLTPNMIRDLCMEFVALAAQHASSTPVPSETISTAYLLHQSLSSSK